MSPRALDSFFERVPFKTKLLIAVGVICLVIAGFYFIIYSNQNAKIGQMEQEIKNLDRQAAIFRDNSDKLKAIEDRIKDLEEEIAVVATVLPNQKEIPELLKNISSTGRMAGLDFLLFRPGNEIKLEHVVEIPVQMEIQGTFLNTATFFYRMARLSRVVNIQSFNMGKAITKDEGIILTTTVTAKTFRLLSETEKRELEEKKKEEALQQDKKRRKK